MLDFLDRRKYTDSLRHDGFQDIKPFLSTRQKKIKVKNYTIRHVLKIALSMVSNYNILSNGGGSIFFVLLTSSCIVNVL